MKNVEGLARIFKVLGEPNRLDIVLAIGTTPRSVTEIVKLTNLSQTLVSFHLKTLRNNGILKTERDGPFVFYTLANTSLIDLLDDFSQAAPLEVAQSGKVLASNRVLERQRRWFAVWWDGSGCGPVYGWWIMPIIGLLFLLAVLFFMSRFFGGGGGFCGRPHADRDGGMEELRKEIRALRDEVKDLKDRDRQREKPWIGRWRPLLHDPFCGHRIRGRQRQGIQLQERCSSSKGFIDGGAMASSEKIDEMISGMTPSLKKELLNELVASLLKEVSEEDKKQVLQAVLSSRKGSGQVIDMVEHWIKECTDSGVNPVEMGKEVVSAISRSYELVTYSTPELRGLFNDWLGEIEREVLEFFADRGTADPEVVAKRFRLQRESAIFILSKLAREEKINLQASGNWEMIRGEGQHGG